MSHLNTSSDLWDTYYQSPFSWEASQRNILYKPVEEDAAQLTAKRAGSWLDEANNAS